MDYFQGPMQYLREPGGLLSTPRVNPHVDPIVGGSTAPEIEFGPGGEFETGTPVTPMTPTPPHHPSDIDPWAGRTNPGGQYWSGYDNRLTPAPPQIDITNLVPFGGDEEIPSQEGFDDSMPSAEMTDEGLGGQMGEPVRAGVTRVDQAIERFNM